MNNQSKELQIGTHCLVPVGAVEEGVMSWKIPLPKGTMDREICIREA